MKTRREAIGILAGGAALAALPLHAASRPNPSAMNLFTQEDGKESYYSYYFALEGGGALHVEPEGVFWENEHGKSRIADVARMI